MWRYKLEGGYEMKQSYKCPECEGRGCDMNSEEDWAPPCPSCKGTGIIECEVRR